jgi:glucokinase
MTARAALAIDIGGTTTKLGIVFRDGGAEMISATSTASDSADPFDHVVSAAGEVREAALRAGINVAGVGVSVAGFIDEARTRMVFNPNLPRLVDYPIVERLQAQLGMPATLEVDSNSACVAEYRAGAGRDARRLLVLTIGTGLGCGVMTGGELVRLAGECIGDAGHVIVEPGGPECTAGCRGCAESMVAAPAIQRRDGGLRSARTIIECARSGDATARRTLAETGRYVGLAMASLAAIFLPDCIVVSAGIAAAGELLLNSAERSFHAAAGTLYRSGVRLCRSTLCSRAPLIGAGLTVLNSAPITAAPE